MNQIVGASYRGGGNTNLSGLSRGSDQIVRSIRHDPFSFARGQELKINFGRFDAGMSEVLGQPVNRQAATLEALDGEQVPKVMKAETDEFLIVLAGLLHDGSSDMCKVAGCL